MLERGTPDSDLSLAFCNSMRTRRAQKHAIQLPAASIPKLKDWVNEPTSSLLLAESRGIRTSPLDFAVEFLNDVREREYPIIWALPFLAESLKHSVDGISAASGSTIPPRLTMAGILRSLVLQTLHLSTTAMTESRNPVTMRHLRGAATIEQWFQLLERCISTFPALFIVLDMGVLEAATCSGADDENEDDGGHYRINDFIARISDIATCRHRRGRLKVVIATVSFRNAASMEADEVFGDTCISTDRGRQIGRLMRQPKYRGIFRQHNKRISEEIRTTVGIFKNRTTDGGSR